MSTVIRPEVSKKSQYYISKHRYYELRHYCQQYKEWQDCYRFLSQMNGTVSVIPAEKIFYNRKIMWNSFEEKSDAKADFLRAIQLVNNCAKDADEELSDYILLAVTENVSFVKLKTQYNMPCEKDMFYDRFRKFFWLLSQRKGI